jgi:hypothetical protein
MKSRYEVYVDWWRFPGRFDCWCLQIKFYSRVNYKPIIIAMPVEASGEDALERQARDFVEDLTKYCGGDVTTYWNGLSEPRPIHPIYELLGYSLY